MKAKLVDRQKETPGITSYFFETTRQIHYIPGHFVYLTIPHLKNDKRGDTREFSISSSPTEGKRLRLTIKDGFSEFKRNLKKLSLGHEVEIDGSHGVYTWDDLQDKAHVFIAGGVGITPFRSRIKYNMDKKLKTKITLLYSITGIQNAPFLDELQTTKNLKLHLIDTLTQPKINKKLIKNNIDNLYKKIFWICGPTSMVDALEEILLNLKIDSENIKTEKFTGLK